MKTVWHGNELYRGDEFVGRVLRAPKTSKGVQWLAWAIDVDVNRLGTFATADEAKAAVEQHMKEEV